MKSRVPLLFLPSIIDRDFSVFQYALLNFCAKGNLREQRYSWYSNARALLVGG